MCGLCLGLEVRGVSHVETCEDAHLMAPCRHIHGTETLLLSRCSLIGQGSPLWPCSHHATPVSRSVSSAREADSATQYTRVSGTLFWVKEARQERGDCTKQISSCRNHVTAASSAAWGWLGCRRGHRHFSLGTECSMS